MVITGAGDGIMGAAQGGAGREASFGVNIRLPFEQQPNAVIAGDSKLINFRYFFTRKLIFVKEAHAIALFPGGFGTHDEGFEALTLIQTGKSEIVPVVFVDAPGGTYWRDWERYVDSHLRERDLISPDDLALFRVTDDVDVAVRESRRLLPQLPLEPLRARPAGAARACRARRGAARGAQREFADVLVDGRHRSARPLPEEEGEDPDLARLRCSSIAAGSAGCAC